MIQQSLLRPMCRSITHSSAPESALSPSHKRHAHWVSHFPRNNKSVPMRQRFPNFEASSLLIDLDAEDCHGVRTLNEPAEVLSQRTRNRRVDEITELKWDVWKFHKMSAKCDHQVSQIKKDVFSYLRINDFDLLAAVLLGSESTTPNLEQQSAAGHRQDLVHVLQGNAVQDSVRNTVPSITMYMLKRQHVAWKTAPEKRHYTFFKRAVKHAESFHILERLVTNTMQTANGRSLVSRRGQDVADKCDSFRETASESTENAHLVKNEKILFFVNNIILNFQHHQMEPPESLCILALSLAQDCGIDLEHTRQPALPVTASQASSKNPASESLEPVLELEDTTFGASSASPEHLFDRPSPFLARSKRRPVLHGPVHPMPEPPTEQRPEARVAYG